MPSHIVHRVVSEKICSASFKEVDELVDEVTWVDVETLKKRGRPKTIEEIVRNYELGLLGTSRPVIEPFVTVFGFMVVYVF